MTKRIIYLYKALSCLVCLYNNRPTKHCTLQCNAGDEEEYSGSKSCKEEQAESQWSVAFKLAHEIGIQETVLQLGVERIGLNFGKLSVVLATLGRYLWCRYRHSLVLDEADVRPAKPRIHSCISLSLSPCQHGPTDSPTGKSESTECICRSKSSRRKDEGEERRALATPRGNVGQSDSLL